MPNKLQQAAEKRKLKHVPVSGSDLWLQEKVDSSDLKAVAHLVPLLFMGLKDQKKWLEELEEAYNGIGAHSEDFYANELRQLKMKVDNLEKQLKAALEEVEHGNN